MAVAHLIQGGCPRGASSGSLPATTAGRAESHVAVRTGPLARIHRRAFVDDVSRSQTQTSRAQVAGDRGHQPGQRVPVELVRPAEAVQHPRHRVARHRVPLVVGELDVADHRPVPVAPRDRPQVDACRSTSRPWPIDRHVTSRMPTPNPRMPALPRPVQATHLHRHAGACLSRSLSCATQGRRRRVVQIPMAASGSFSWPSSSVVAWASTAVHPSLRPRPIRARDSAELRHSLGLTFMPLVDPCGAGEAMAASEPGARGSKRRRK